MQHVIVIINNKYFTIDKTNYFSLLDFFFVHAFVAVLQHYYLFYKNRYNIVTLQVILHFCLFLHDAERPKREKLRFCMVQKGQKEKKHTSARCRKAKKSKNTLLHGAERPKRAKTRFCTAQKGQKEKKHASARCRKVKKRKNTFLSDSERVKKRKNMFLSDSEGLKSEKTCF